MCSLSHDKVCIDRVERSVADGVLPGWLGRNSALPRLYQDRLLCTYINCGRVSPQSTGLAVCKSRFSRSSGHHRNSTESTVCHRDRACPYHALDASALTRSAGQAQSNRSASDGTRSCENSRRSERGSSNIGHAITAASNATEHRSNRHCSGRPATGRLAPLCRSDSTAISSVRELSARERTN